VDEPEADVEPPLHPAGVRPHDSLGGVGEPELCEELVDAAAEFVAAHPLDVALEHEVLAAGRLTVDARLLRHVPDGAPDDGGLADDVVPGHLRVAGVGPRERREHAHGGRLSCAVRAEEAEDLALAHGEANAVERLDRLRVGLLEPVDDDRVHGIRL
jgi:hypothetical protein